MTKGDRSLLQSVLDIAKNVRYYQMWQLDFAMCIRYYKVRQTVTTKCIRYYKVRRNKLNISILAVKQQSYHALTFQLDTPLYYAGY